MENKTQEAAETLPANLVNEEQNAEQRAVPLKKAFAFHQSRHIPTPKEIKSELDQYIVGQDAAKKVLAVEVHNHYLRLRHRHLPKAIRGNVEIKKSNVLLLGPTGSGKTLLAQILAKSLSVPFAVADATNMTEAGFIGGKVEDSVANLLRAAHDNVKSAERGIIYIDEVDKIAAHGSNGSRDVSGQGAQRGLLKLLEGTQCKPNKGKQTLVDTKDILFICGGAFVGLDKIVAKRLGAGKGVIGFNQKQRQELSSDELLALMEPCDLIEYGFMPELIGRLPVSAPLHGLTRKDLVRILTEPKTSLIGEYQALMRLDGVQLEFTASALTAIADKALVRATGARGLRSIVAKVMQVIQFETPEWKPGDKFKFVTVDDTMIKKDGIPPIVFREMNGSVYAAYFPA